MQQTFSVLLKKKDDSLARLYGFLCGRAFHIHSTTVGTTEDERYWRVTLMTSPDEPRPDKLFKELCRLMDVVNVTNLTDMDHVSRQFALIWVQSSPEDRPLVERLVRRGRGKIVHETPVGFTVEVTGRQEDIEALAQDLRSCGRIRMTCTGLVALALDGLSAGGDEQSSAEYQAAHMA